MTIHRIVACSFCGKSQHAVFWLIAARDVYICDECVGVCTEIMAEKRAAKAAKTMTEADLTAGTVLAAGRYWDAKTYGTAPASLTVVSGSPTSTSALSPGERQDYGTARAMDAAFDAIRRLWANRSTAGMTQADICRAVALSPEAVAQALHGPAHWSMRTFGALAEAMDGDIRIEVKPRGVERPQRVDPSFLTDDEWRVLAEMPASDKLGALMRASDTKITWRLCEMGFLAFFGCDMYCRTPAGDAALAARVKT